MQEYKINVIAGTKALADMTQSIKDKTINDQRMKAVPPGALPAGPADKEMYMELLSEGTWTWNGVAAVTNAKGSISIAWWNKVSWSKNDGVALPFIPVSNSVIAGGNEATSQDAVYKFADPVFKNKTDNKYVNVFTIVGNITSAGALNPASAWRCTDYVKVFKDDLVTIKTFVDSYAGKAPLAFYDEDKKFISALNIGSTTGYATKTATVPDNGYIIASHLTGGSLQPELIINAKMYLTPSSLDVSGGAASLKKVENVIANKSGKFKTIPDIIVNKGFSINSADGTINVVTGSNWWISDLFELSEGETIQAKTYIDGVSKARIAIYLFDGTFSHSVTSFGNAFSKYTATGERVKIRLCHFGADKNQVEIYLQDLKIFTENSLLDKKGGSPSFENFTETIKRLDKKTKILENETNTKGGLVSYDFFNSIIKDLKVSESRFTYKTNVLKNPKIPINMVAYGREVGGVRKSIVINANGLCHPDIINVNGWNGYKYILALTPYFGVIGVQAEYENPTVFATNDESWESWDILNDGMPIDLPQNGNSSFWADTDVIFYKNELYVFYKGFGFQGIGSGEAFLCFRKTSDLNNWTERKTIYLKSDTNNIGKEVVSPAVIVEGDSIFLYAIALGATGMTSNNMPPSRLMFRAKLDENMQMQKITEDNVVNLNNTAWASNFTGWHLDVKKKGNLYIMLLCVGDSEGFGGTENYIGYSTDAFNFTFISGEISNKTVTSYRGTALIDGYYNNVLSLRTFIGKTNGEIELRSIDLEG